MLLPLHFEHRAARSIASTSTSPPYTSMRSWTDIWPTCPHRQFRTRWFWWIDVNLIMFYFCSHCLKSARQKCIVGLPLNDAAFHAPAVNSVGAFLIVTPLDISSQNWHKVCKLNAACQFLTDPTIGAPFKPPQLGTSAGVFFMPLRHRAHRSLLHREKRLNRGCALCFPGRKCLLLVELPLLFLHFRKLLKVTVNFLMF